MSYRYMRAILFFDLPVEKKTQQREYRTFVKNIKKLGFYMLQKSVYIKMGIDIQAINSVVDKIKKNCPKEGAISILTITEKQFSSMEMVLGEGKTDVVNSDKRVVEL